MAPVTQALKCMLTEFLKEFGQHSLIPHRAFTNELLNKMFNLNSDIRVSSQKEVAWEGFEGLNLRACLAVAKSTGCRKAELVSAQGT